MQNVEKASSSRIAAWPPVLTIPEISASFSRLCVSIRVFPICRIFASMSELVPSTVVSNTTSFGCCLMIKPLRAHSAASEYRNWQLRRTSIASSNFASSYDLVCTTIESSRRREDSSQTTSADRRSEIALDRQAMGSRALLRNSSGLIVDRYVFRACITCMRFVCSPEHWRLGSEASVAAMQRREIEGERYQMNSCLDSVSLHRGYVPDAGHDGTTGCIECSLSFRLKAPHVRRTPRPDLWLDGL